MASEIQKYIKDDGIQKMIKERIGARSGQLTTSLLSVVNNNELLQKADPVTVISAALIAGSLDLPIQQNLGFAYIVPYKNGKTGKYEGQFQMGARGYKQLAQRTGLYKFINDSDVREGELRSHNRLTGAIEFSWIEDEVARMKAPVVGYVSYFELHNGFSSTVYMSLAGIREHAKKYSQSFKSGFGPWKDNFDAMALKTVTKQNLSKNGPLSTEMQTAIASDQAVIREDGKAEYIDGEVSDDFTELPQEAVDAIKIAESAEELEGIVTDLTVEQRKAAVPLINARMTELNPPKK